MNRALPLIFSRIFNRPLLVHPAFADSFIAGLPAAIAGGMPIRMAFDDNEDKGPDPRRSGYTIRQNVATIPVHGALVRRAGQITPDCVELMSYERLQNSLRTASRDPRVRGIMLDMDTPGGEVDAVFDLAREIRMTSQTKPIWSIANDSMFSAGSVLGTAANRVWVTRTGGAGSLGVVAMHTDQSEFDARAGINYTYIHAGARKIDGHPHAPLSREAHSAIQAEVDRLNDILIDTVAEHRGVSREQIAAQDAALYFGADAITARLADQIGTPDEAHAALVQHVTPPSSRRTSAVSDNPNPGDPPVADPAPNPSPNPTPEPAPAPAGDPQPEPQSAMVVAIAGARQSEHQANLEIVELCITAGRPALAAELMRAKMTVEQARRHLIDLAAKAQRPITPVTTDPPPNRQERVQAELAKAVEARFAAQRAEHRG